LDLVLEDYLQMLLQYISLAPDVLFTSSSFDLAFRCAMTGLTVVHTDIIFASLDFFRGIFMHDCMEPQTSATPPNFVVYASAIRSAMNKEGLQLVAYLVNGLVGEFPADAAAVVVSIFRTLVQVWSDQVPIWLAPVLEQLPATSVPNDAKAKFLQEVTQ
jgi:transportin-3